MVRSVLGRSWWQALIAALGQRALDFAALLLALYASGARVSPLLVLLAYAVAQILMIIPITPGGSASSSWGWSAFSAWPAWKRDRRCSRRWRIAWCRTGCRCPIGAGAYAWFSRRYGRGGATAAAAPPRPSPPRRPS